MSDSDGETTVAELDADDQRSMVRERYADIAAASGDCCGEAAASDCCDGSADSGPDDPVAADVAQLGYDEDEASVDAADLSLGCGNPGAIAGLSPGERVLDLGSGGGFDCFLAAREVGPEGRVTGVDMTPAMIERARENAADSDFDTVDFRLGEIEHLPVADDSVDVVISNCVVNLSPDKAQVFREVARVLAPGGRVAISDVVETAPMPEEVRADPDSVSACIAGAATIDRLETLLADAGFTDIAIEPDDDSEAFIREWDPERDPSEYVTAATIEARLPE